MTRAISVNSIFIFYVRRSEGRQHVNDSSEIALPLTESSAVPKQEVFVRERGTRMDGHDPQSRDDIVQELVTDIVAGKLTRKDIENRETISRDARSQERLRQNRHRDVSIDQSRDDDEDGLKLRDVLEG